MDKADTFQRRVAFLRQQHGAAQVHADARHALERRQLAAAAEVEARNLRLYHDLQARQLPDKMRRPFLQMCEVAARQLKEAQGRRATHLAELQLVRRRGLGTGAGREWEGQLRRRASQRDGNIAMRPAAGVRCDPLSPADPRPLPLTPPPQMESQHATLNFERFLRMFTERADADARHLVSELGLSSAHLVETQAEKRRGADRVLRLAELQVRRRRGPPGWSARAHNTPRKAPPLPPPPPPPPAPPPP
jgi:hypothetical protein